MRSRRVPKIRFVSLCLLNIKRQFAMIGVPDTCLPVTTSSNIATVLPHVVATKHVVTPRQVKHPAIG